MQSHNLIIIITVTNSHYHTSVPYKLSSRPVKQQICSQVIQSEITYIYNYLPSSSSAEACQTSTCLRITAVAVIQRGQKL